MEQYLSIYVSQLVSSTFHHCDYTTHMINPVLIQLNMMAHENSKKEAVVWQANYILSPRSPNTIHRCPICILKS